MTATVSHTDVVEFRQRRSMTQADLAGTLGTSVDFIQRLEAGNVEIEEQLEALLIRAGVEPGLGGPPAVAVVQTTDPEPVQEEQTPAFDRSDGVRRISNSEVQAFKRCKRSWWLSWYRGLAPKHESQVGVQMVGNRLHRALEDVYAPGGPYLDRARDAMESIIEADRRLVEQLDMLTQQQFAKESDLERIMLDGYVDWVEETGADENLEIVGSEQYVEHDLSAFSHAGGLKIIGRLDVIVRQKSNGELRFIDHKTVGSLGQIMKTMRINEQSRHYQLLQWMQSQGDRVGGIIFNMMRRVKRTKTATPPFYAREEITHNRTVIETYYDRLVAEIWQILRTEDDLKDASAQHQEIVPPTVSQFCEWGCPFLKVCSMFDDGSRVEDAIAAEYEVVDPLSYYDRPKEGTNV